MVFSNADQAINVLFTITARLGALIVWLFIAVAHLFLLLVLLVVLWASGTSPVDLWSGTLELLKSNAFAFLGFAGLSLAAIASLYWKLAKWVHREPGAGWMFDYVTRTIPRR